MFTGFNDKQGSKWRKWDLHIHCPTSILNNQFQGSSDNEKWERYLSKLEEYNDIIAVAVTDYFSIEGYNKILEYKALGRIPNINLILPNVELRIIPVTQQNKPINLHIIFSPEIVSELDSIFFNELEFHHNFKPYKCTKSDLIKLGKSASGNNELDDFASYRIGCEQFKVDLNNLYGIFKKHKELKDNSLICISNSNNDGNSGIQDSNLREIRKELYKFSQIIFSGNPNDIKYFLGKGADSKDKIIKEYGGLKPCVIGSDAHSLDKIFKPDFERFTWIKADPTFIGLKQIIYEPEDRIYIGKEPPLLQKVKNNGGNFIKNLNIIKDDKLKEEWFNKLNINFNCEMISIIGNKGNGKSALLDILGLLGNSMINRDEYSFLNKDKFLKSPNKAIYFTGKLTFRNDFQNKKELDKSVGLSDFEFVKYIPQQYLENLCNKFKGDENNDEFEKELKGVIFSHVPEKLRLGKNSLTELENYRVEIIQNKIQKSQLDLIKINEQIVTLELKNTKAYREKIGNELRIKGIDLLKFEKTKPLTLAEPIDLNKQSSEELSALENRIKILEEGKIKDQYLAELSYSRYTRIKKLKQKIELFSSNYEAFIKEITPELSDFKLLVDDIIEFKIEWDKINLIEDECKKVMDEYDSLIDSENKKSASYKINELNKEYLELKSKLDEPQQQYRNYLEELKIWQQKYDSLNSVVLNLRNENEYLQKDLPHEIMNLRNERLIIVNEIIQNKFNIINEYKQLYLPLQEFIKEFNEENKDYNVNFNVRIRLKDFKDRYFSYINRRIWGSYMEIESSEKNLQQIIDNHDLNNEENIISFLDQLIISLEKNSNEENAPNEIPKQIYNDKYEEFYNFIFGLDYLIPSYEIKLGNKSINQLSPGEKGALLLIFYLLIDQNDVPLIIDQPEENLDNQSVFELLVPNIKKAKKRRQIIIVTHNPNLAVVCDSEQIIYVKIDKENKNKVEVVSGGIENKDINKKILEILEGTSKAFNIRSSKYNLSDRLNV